MSFDALLNRISGQSFGGGLTNVSPQDKMMGKYKNRGLYVLVPKGPDRVEAVKLGKYLKSKSIHKIEERVKLLEVGNLPVCQLFTKGRKAVVKGGQAATEMLKGRSLQVGRRVLSAKNITVQKLSATEYQQMLSLVTQAFQQMKAQREAATKKKPATLSKQPDGTPRTIRHVEPDGKKAKGKKQKQHQKQITQITTTAKAPFTEHARNFDKKAQEYAEARDKEYDEKQLGIRKDEIAKKQSK